MLGSFHTGGAWASPMEKVVLVRMNHVQDRHDQTRKRTAVAFSRRSRLDQNVAVGKAEQMVVVGVSKV